MLLLLTVAALISLISHTTSIYVPKDGESVYVSDDILTSQLDTLDQKMDLSKNTKEKEHKRNKGISEGPCAFANLSFCGTDVDYKIPLPLAKLSFYVDALAEAAIDTMYINSRGEIRKCQDNLKRVICHDQFPKCNATTKQIRWGNLDLKCGIAIGTCSAKAQAMLAKDNICAKLSTGTKDINQCVPPFVIPELQICKVSAKDRVSPWLIHSSIQMDAVLGIQFDVFQVSQPCRNKVSQYLCSMSSHCWVPGQFVAAVEKFHHLCLEAEKACVNDQFGKAVHKLFLDCSKIKKALEIARRV